MDTGELCTSNEKFRCHLRPKEQGEALELLGRLARCFSQFRSSGWRFGLVDLGLDLSPLFLEGEASNPRTTYREALLTSVPTQMMSTKGFPRLQFTANSSVELELSGRRLEEANHSAVFTSASRQKCNRASQGIIWHVRACQKVAKVLMDNAKFIMMVLVVLTHSMAATYPSLALLRAIHPFQTRTFAFISGAVNRKHTREALFQASRDTVVQILWFSTFLEPVCYKFMSGTSPLRPPNLKEVFSLLFFSGAHIHWYLYGLLWWRLASHMLLHLRPIERLSISLMISAAATWTYVDFLSTSEALACLPLYTAGQICGDAQFLERYKGWETSTRDWLGRLAGLLLFFGLDFMWRQLGWTQHYPFSMGCIPWAVQEGSYSYVHVGMLLWLLRGVAGHGVCTARDSKLSHRAQSRAFRGSKH